MTFPFTAADLDVLKQWDTPTICNALEIVVPERRAIGFTIEPFVTADDKLPPIVGLARTAYIRAREKPRSTVSDPLDYYDYVADAQMPTIMVIQDLDDRPGFGAWWGEVNTAIHTALGSLGCVTNGSFRDRDALAPGFQILGGRMGPSHAHVHVVDYGRPVDIFGMHAVHDDVIHGDCHGAVVVPADAVKKLPAAVDLVIRREKVILDVARSPDFTPAKLRAAIKASGEIH